MGGHITRRSAFMSAGAMAAATGLNAQTGGEVPAASAEQQIELAQNSGMMSGLHAVIARVRGEDVMQIYFEGADENWGRPLGQVTHGPETLHDLRSVTKSLTSLLYGIALNDGAVPEPDAMLMDAFPDYPDLASDPARQAWTIAHALTMTLGTDWNEDLPYTDPANSEIAMEQAEDRYRFILDRPIVAAPGERWIYNGGATALIGHIIERGTGQTLADFANDRLFAPLGIGQYEWNAGQDGVLSAASGLRMTAPDLMKIGQMVLSGGQWDGDPIVPERWLEALQTPRATTQFGGGYSYQWYLSRQPVARSGQEVQVMSAIGNGGQRLFVVPEFDMSAVVFAGNYNFADQWLEPTLILQRVLLPLAAGLQ